MTRGITISKASWALLEQAQRLVTVPKAAPLTYIEHQSNSTSWLETIAEVEGLSPDKHGLVDPAHLAEALDQHRTSSLSTPTTSPAA